MIQERLCVTYFSRVTVDDIISGFTQCRAKRRKRQTLLLEVSLSDHEFKTLPGVELHFLV